MRRDSDAFLAAREKGSSLDSLTHSNMAIEARRGSLERTISRQDSDPFGSFLRSDSFGFRRRSSRLDTEMFDRRDSFTMGIQPSPDFLPVLRQQSGVSEFWEEEDIPPRIASPLRERLEASPKKKARTHRDDDGEFANVKLGDQRRKMIKSAISEKCQSDPRLREKVKIIGSIKTATVTELMQMADACGFLDWALNLVKSRLVEKQIGKHA